VIDRVVVEADGGSRGNPGPAGYGAVVRDAVTGALLAERSGSVGVATNNVAEYSGLLAGLEAAAGLGACEVDVRMDSKLVVEQMCGRWQVKHPSMRPLASKAGELVRRFDAVRFTWIPRAQNSAADRLANLAMDGKPVNRDLVGEAADPAPADDDPDPAVESPARAEAASPAGAPGWGAPTSTPTTTLLVRHGASVLSPERRFSGRGDVPLSPDGAEQARRVAARLRGRAGISAVISSPLRRARRTAEMIAAAVGLTVTVVDDLIETDFGDWEGLTFAEVQQKWPDELTAWLASPDAAPPRGESFAATAERVLRARDRLVAQHPASSIVVVSHVGPVKTLLRDALAAPAQTMFRMQIDVASVSEVDWYPDGPATVRLVNDAHHLAVG
jgi:broad specificity phosphatase PhoE/ribonuclease HI